MAGLMFPVGDVRKDLSPKKRVLGIRINGIAKAYPIEQITTKPDVIQDKIDGVLLKIHINHHLEIIRVTDENGNTIPHSFAFWFAWQAFHPDTLVFEG